MKLFVLYVSCSFSDIFYRDLLHVVPVSSLKVRRYDGELLFFLLSSTSNAVIQSVDHDTRPCFVCFFLSWFIPTCFFVYRSRHSRERERERQNEISYRTIRSFVIWAFVRLCVRGERKKNIQRERGNQSSGNRCSCILSGKRRRLITLIGRWSLHVMTYRFLVFLFTCLLLFFSYSPTLTDSFPIDVALIELGDSNRFDAAVINSA